MPICNACNGKGWIAYDATLLDLMKAYAEIMQRKAERDLKRREESPNG